MMIMASLLFLSPAASPANNWVQFGDQNAACTDFDATSTDMPMVAVVRPPAGQTMSFFRPDGEPCATSDEQCPSPVRLASGATVVVTSSTDVRSCVHYIAANGTIRSGYVRAPWLHFLSSSEARLDDPRTAGQWTSWHDTTLDLRRLDDGLIAFEIETTLGPPRYRSNTVAGVAQLSDNGRLAGYSDSGYAGNTPSSAPVTPDNAENCRIRLRLVSSDFLTVDSNDACGLSFDGLFRKAPLRKPARH